ncbi:MAG: hypothetical protein K9N38_11360 [Candidatus Marinimicrobia bacterium]|nr:hypothetical protein [Candidatus Neomarinimicrobiota bacterium]MCF7851511.1 hypothetical protein [Candidatus Neomarinimicrobiota bacterium]
MNRRKFIRSFSFAGVAFLLAACIPTEIFISRRGRHGPPSHAPAHGHRKKNRHGIEMTYDSNLGIYIVVGYTGYYYYDGIYYRKQNNQWESSKDLKKDWKKSSKHGMPKGLKNK